MHELGVVFSIIRDLEDVAQKNNVSKIVSVTLSLGEVSSVIPSYLTDCWKWAVSKNELLKDAPLNIEKIEAVTHCDNCGEDYRTVEFGRKCPKCQSYNTYLLCGNEFLIKEIEAT